ncbi:dopaminechrome tautomerase-like isoform X1 [Euwallacea similis]|uniref:dopaminechrome tautomerase-like isoform X1 n=1 Tax=Euwallacea similis TaxID=1736056 RepID=UPI00344B48E7
MALDNWFHQEWHPPAVQNTFFEPSKKYINDHDYHVRKKFSNTTNNYLPIFLAFQFLKPQEEDHQKNEGTQIEGTHTLDNHEAARRVPLEVSEEDRGYSRRPAEEFFPKFYSSYTASDNPYIHSLGFPDPFANPNIVKNEAYKEAHNSEPLEISGPFKTLYRWKTLDFAYPSLELKSKAIANEDFVAENNLPLGIEVYKHRVFLSMPKWKKGVPVTLAQIPRVPNEESPELIPYPNWEWHSEKTCELITSVFRMQVDTCGRLWVLDSGKIMITTEEATQHCPPKLLIFDLETDELLTSYIFDKKFTLQDGLYSNIIVDIRDNDCEDAYAYMSDVWRFGIVVYRLFDGNAWRISNHLFYPDPLAAHYRLHHLRFYWMDGIFGMALSPSSESHEDRLLYFHSMSGYHEFYVKTSYLRKESVEKAEHAFKILGQSRGDQGHVSSSVMDDNGIMFYNLVALDSIGCWDSRKPYVRANLGLVAKDKRTLVFPNDIRLDQDKRQSMWIITNRLPYYLIEGLDISKFNFRVMSAYTDDAIKGTVCDPNVRSKGTFVEPNDGIGCR